MKSTRPKFIPSKHTRKAEAGIDVIMKIALRDPSRARITFSEITSVQLYWGIRALLAWTESDNKNQRRLAYVLLARLALDGLHLDGLSTVYFIKLTDDQDLIEKYFR